MDAYEFYGNVLVEAQGPRVLRLIQRHPDHAEYEVIGFHGMVTVKDYRPDALAALDIFANDSRAIDFGNEFSQPSAAQIGILEGHISIWLNEPDEGELRHMLWIAVGLENELPVLDYEMIKIEHLQGGSFAVVALSRLNDVDSQLELPLLTVAAI